MNDGRRLRRQDRQAVVDGSGQSSVSRDGKAGNFAEGEGVKNSLAHFEPLHRTVRLTTQWRVGATVFPASIKPDP